MTSLLVARCCGIAVIFATIVFFVLQPNPGVYFALNPFIIFDPNSSPIIAINLNGWGVVIVAILGCAKFGLL